MTDAIIDLGNGFWTLRGSFRLFGVLDVGTQAALVRRRSGAFVLLDSYTLDGPVKAAVMDLTGNGQKVEAILNLHPFHTVHCARMHRDFPAARLYGTARHARRAPDLPWQALHTDDPQLQALFADDLQFSVPRGVDFISADETVHFSSVLAYHPASRTIHADDTLTYVQFGAPLGWLIPERVSFHPTLARALEKRAGAAADFRAWAQALASGWKDAENLCAAHNRLFQPGKTGGLPLAQQIAAALARVEGKLAAHGRRYG